MQSVTILPGRDKAGNPEPFQNITLERGELCTIVGNTGSGKSRLIKDVEQLARGGQKQLLSLIPEQLGPILLLQGVDVLGDGGLGNVKQLGGAGKIFGLADSEKGLNPEIQHSGHLGIIII